MVLAKLGLRASEVAALSLDDIDWRSGKILVHGKGRRQATMPLRHDVGTVSSLTSGMGDQLHRAAACLCERLLHMSALPPAAPSR